MTLLEAIAFFEGFNASPRNRPTRNRNPGNLEWGAFARRHGATRIEEIPEGYTSKPRYAFFPDPETGWKAMHALYSGPGYKHLTVSQAIHKHAPPSENDTAAFIRFVCDKVGCKPETMVSELLPKGSDNV